MKTSSRIKEQSSLELGSLKKTHKKTESLYVHPLFIYLVSKNIVYGVLRVIRHKSSFKNIIMNPNLKHTSGFSFII